MRCGALLVLARADSHVAGDCACSLVTSHDRFGGVYGRGRAIDYDINLIQAELKLHLLYDHCKSHIMYIGLGFK